MTTNILMLIWFFSIFFLFGLKSCNHSENTNHDYVAIGKSNFLFKKNNEIYFKCYSQEKKDFRYLNIVYTNPEYFSNDLNEYGIEKIGKIVDSFSFVKINDTLFKDNNHMYIYKMMKSGGTLALYEN